MLGKGLHFTNILNRFILIYSYNIQLGLIKRVRLIAVGKKPEHGGGNGSTEIKKKNHEMNLLKSRRKHES
jgi:hypothetical protein